MKKVRISATMIVALACLSFILVFSLGGLNAQSRTKSYYSGEAISFNDNLVFATVNTGALELFTLKNNKIVRTAMFKPRFVRLPKGSENYGDLLFDVKGGNLYLYLVNGRYLYKYNVSDVYNPVLLEKIKDNAWDWFTQLEKTDKYLVTIGTKEIKYWNKNLQVVNSFKIDYKKPENVSFSSDGKYIFSVVDDGVNVYDTTKRAVKSTIHIVSKNKGSLRGLQYDNNQKEIYIADDEALKIFDLNARELRRFKHSSNYAYDVQFSKTNNSLYFSDGLGIVRNDRNNLKALNWKYTTDIGGGHGWAMGIDTARDRTGEKVVVFNNKEILVLNDALKLVDYFKASEIDNSPIEKLYLHLDKNQAWPGDYTTVNGGGFGINEKLVITMGDQKWEAKSDSNGRFKRTITVADLKAQRIDIKVDGLASKLTYSISLKIN